MSEDSGNMDEGLETGLEAENGQTTAHSAYTPLKDDTGMIRHQLSGMYQGWFLDYASSTILDRAVPHFVDGLKPVQRRILHSMKRLDDGRFNKVANIVGHTMQFHPHGDVSIGDALVQMGQKNLLIECQGNWGNILTGHKAAAPRYIEARLSKFALETLFNPKTTEWKASYDGRNKEPVTLPVKFPLLLAQGAEGIAVGLSCKIIPHNFNELCDAAVSYLNNEEFHLYPDFQTGGAVDVSRYNDGERGGMVRIRAKISKEADNKTLVITEIPYGENVMTLCDSIVKAGEKRKINIRKVENLTSDKVEIRITLAPGVSSDKTIDALFAFTNCEVSISPNCCVIDENKPHFLTVSDVLRKSVDNTKELLRRELEIAKAELLEQLHFASLEEIFIEERIYKDKEFEQAENMDAACEHIDDRLTPYYPQMIREVTKDDILRLMEIKMARILKFNKEKAEEAMAKMKSEIARINRDLSNMVGVTIKWFRMLKDKYGGDYPRRTEIKNFDTIVATKVIEANLKLYINRADGFIGTELKKDEYVCNCSGIDDVILFYKDGRYKVVKVADKLFVGQNVLFLNVFKKNDKRTIYNVAYRDGKKGACFVKRFAATGLTRDKEYDLTQGKPGSKILYFSANQNGEAEVIKVILKPNPKLRKQVFDKDFREINIKGRQSMGNLLTRNEVQRIGLKSRGTSTLGGRKVWYDSGIMRLDFDGHGEYIDEFDNDDLLLVIMQNGEYYTTVPDPNCHFDAGIMKIEKFERGKVWTALLFDASRHLYIKRFTFDPSSKRVSIPGDDKGSRLVLLTDTWFPRILVTMGGNDSFREPLEIDAEQYVGVKGIKAKGRRVTSYKVDKVEELEPLRFPETKTENAPDEPFGDADVDNESGSYEDNDKQEDGQLSLF